MMEKIKWKIHLFVVCVVMDCKNAMLKYRIWRCRKRQERIQRKIDRLKRS